MNHSSQHQPEVKDPKHEESLAPIAKAEADEEASLRVKDQDRTLSMIVLLLVCLGLAALAHVVV